MAYTPTSWTPGVFGTEITSARLNNIETGVEDAHAALGSTVYLPAPSGGNDTTAIQAVISSVPSGGTLYVSGSYRVDGQLDVATPMTIQASGKGFGFYSSAGTSAQTMFNVTSGDVHFIGLKVKGPQFAAAANQTGINFAGTSAASPLTNVTVTECTVTNWGKNGILAGFVKDFAFDRNVVKDCAYTGIGVSCAIGGSIDGNTIRNITQTGYSNSYGIYTTRLEMDSLSTSPRSADISISGNRIYDVPNWDGINTHGGINHTIVGNVVVNCAKPIEIVGSDGNTSGQPKYAPLDVAVIGNTISSTVTNGTYYGGIIFVGAQGAGVVGTPSEYGSGVISGNVVRGHGREDSSISGAILCYYTRGLIVTNNTLVEPSPNGIYMYHTNSGFTITGNTIIDPWTTASALAAAITCGSDYNVGYIGGGNRLVRADKTATIVASRGIYIANTSNNSVTLGDNVMTAATTPVHDSGLKIASIRGALRHGLYSARPTASADYAGATYLATDILGGTEYRCVNTTGTTWAWQQSGAGVNAGVDDGVWRPRDNGMVAWSGDPLNGMLTNQTAMVSGTQYISRVKVDTASAVTNLMFYVITAATSITEASGDLYDSTGARIATVDLATPFASTGLKTVAFAAATATRTPAEVLYVGLRITFTGTAPVVRGASTLSVPNANVSGANSRYGTAGTGVTSPQSSITPASITAVSVGQHCHWVGLT